MNFFKVNTAPFYFKLTIIIVGILSIGYLTVIGKEVLCPLIFGLLFSILLLPPTRFFEKKIKLSRGLASGLSVILLFLTVGGLLLMIGSQLTSLGQDWPLFKAQLIQSLHDFQVWISAQFHIDLAKQTAYFKNATTRIESNTSAMIGATVVSLTSIVLFLVFILIDTFFLLFYRHHFLKFIISVFKEENSGIVLDIVEQIQYIIRKYILGLFLEMLIVATVCCIAFLIVGIKYAILLGLITGVFNLIPYIGIYTALLLNVIITFATAGGAKVLLVMIIVIIMHLIDSNVLLPVIVGSKVRINPFITILGVIAGEMMWGITGMFLSLPVIAVTKIIFDRVETLKSWGMLLGEEETIKKRGKLIGITSKKIKEK